MHRLHSHHRKNTYARFLLNTEKVGAIHLLGGVADYVARIYAISFPGDDIRLRLRRGL